MEQIKNILRLDKYARNRQDSRYVHIQAIFLVGRVYAFISLQEEDVDSGFRMPFTDLFYQFQISQYLRCWLVVKEVNELDKEVLSFPLDDGQILWTLVFIQRLKVFIERRDLEFGDTGFVVRREQFFLNSFIYFLLCGYFRLRRRNWNTAIVSNLNVMLILQLVIQNFHKVVHFLLLIDLVKPRSSVWLLSAKIDRIVLDGQERV